MVLSAVFFNHHPSLSLSSQPTEMPAALECCSREEMLSQLLIKPQPHSDAFRRDPPEKKLHRFSRAVAAAIAALKNSLNLDFSPSYLTHLFPGIQIPEKLLSDIRRHFDSLPNSYSQAGFDFKDVCLHLRLIEQAADDGKPAFQIRRIRHQGSIFKIVFACKSAFSWPMMSGGIGGSVLCCKNIQIFEKKGLTLGVLTVVADACGEKNFKSRIEAALRSAAKKQRNAGVKRHFSLCGCQEEERLVTKEDDSALSVSSEINAYALRRIHIPSPLPEIICSGGVDLGRWLLRAEDMEFVERAGINSFIGCYKGKKVWIKKLKRCERGRAYEIEIQKKLMRLMSCGHKNLLQFCGFCFSESNGLCVVTRLMEGGSVHDLMRSKKVRVRDVMRIALDVSEGLLFMNSHGVAYRDLNRQRILLDGEGNACLGDMGVVSACMKPGDVREYETAGYQWLAPEIIAGDPESKTETWMSNVYSFGIVLWEMVTGEVAYTSYSPVQAAVGIAACGMRPEIPKDCPLVLRSLMIRCWNNCPSKRPQFSEIVAILLKQKICGW